MPEILSRRTRRNAHLVGLYAWCMVLEIFAIFYLPLRAAWLFVWGNWARFWLAVRLWKYQGYRWQAAWRTAAYVMDDLLP